MEERKEKKGKMKTNISLSLIFLGLVVVVVVVVVITPSLEISFLKMCISGENNKKKVYNKKLDPSHIYQKLA